MLAHAPELTIAASVIFGAFALVSGCWLFDWLFPRRVDEPFARDDDWGRQ